MKTRLQVLAGVLAGLLLSAGIWLAALAPHRGSVTLPPLSTSVLIRVKVVGAVVHPGIFKLDKNSRIIDAVQAAGGFLAGADENSLNLAARLENGQRLEIPYQSGFAPVKGQESREALKAIPSPLAGNRLAGSNSPTSWPTLVITSTPTAPCAERAIGSGHFVWPADNHFLSGKDYSSGHPGIDIAAGEGSPIYAADAGIVMAEGDDGSGYGNVIWIDHGNGYTTLYAHLSLIGVSACQGVVAGQWIGAAGATGNSSGVHLHFEVIQDGAYVSPWLVLP